MGHWPGLEWAELSAVGWGMVRKSHSDGIWGRSVEGHMEPVHPFRHSDIYFQ